MPGSAARAIATQDAARANIAPTIRAHAISTHLRSESMMFAGHAVDADPARSERGEQKSECSGDGDSGLARDAAPATGVGCRSRLE